MKFTIHGVRGSVPTPGIEFVKYGGNTSCFEIETCESQIFCDAGTGFRSAKLLNDKKNVWVFLTHFHHDHIQGFPFNPGLFSEGQQISVSSALHAKKTTSTILDRCFSEHFFPVNIFASLSHLSVESFDVATDDLKQDIDVSFIELDHPGGAVGYSFVKENKKVVILLDNEFQEPQLAGLLEFCKDGDLLIWDGMFTKDELLNKGGWGHSSVEQAEEFTELSNVKKTVICHHAPYRTDADIDFLKSRISSDRVSFGREGESFCI
jgi:phosphoribosyl 1,2-cyclic phosphodiesterase